MKLKNLGWLTFVIGLATVIPLILTEKLPGDLLGCFSLMFVLGIVFGETGDRITFIRWEEVLFYVCLAPLCLCILEFFRLGLRIL